MNSLFSLCSGTLRPLHWPGFSPSLCWFLASFAGSPTSQGHSGPGLILGPLFLSIDTLSLGELLSLCLSISSICGGSHICLTSALDPKLTPTTYLAAPTGAQWALPKQYVQAKLYCSCSPPHSSHLHRCTTSSWLLSPKPGIHSLNSFLHTTHPIHWQVLLALAHKQRPYPATCHHGHLSPRLLHSA